METFGTWILVSFVVYYIIALMTKSEHVLGSLALGMILGLGITLAFF